MVLSEISSIFVVFFEFFFSTLDVIDLVHLEEHRNAVGQILLFEKKNWTFIFQNSIENSTDKLVLKYVSKSRLDFIF